MNYFENMLAGLVGIEPTPTVSKTVMISISPKPDMVRLEGFEPPTHEVEARCSNPLSYSRSNLVL